MVTTLDSICTRLSSGGTPSRKNASFFSQDSSGHLWVKSKELLDRAIVDTEERISDEGLAKSAAKYFPEHSVLIAMYGANVGQLGWLRRPATVNQAISGLVVDETKADWRFVFYSLIHNRGDLTVKAHGAAQQNLNQDLVRNFSISLPPLAAQRRIADILFAHDELIENSQRRIKILEQMARSLYREWFVDFRFPGHEKLKFVDSALGRIPEGWEVVNLDTLKAAQANAINGGPFGSKLGTKDYVSTGVPVIRGSNLSESGRFDPSGFVFVSPEKAEELRANLALPGDIVVTQRGTLGQIGMIPTGIGYDRFVISQSQMKITLDPTKVNREYAFFFLRSAESNQRIKNLASSSGVPHINLAVLREFQTLLPPLTLQDEFGRFAFGTETTIEMFSDQIANLRRTRDLLLPRLLSGQIELRAS